MALKPEHFISDETLEARASQLLADYGKNHGLVDRLPIPLEHLLEYHLGLTIDCDVVEGAGPDIPAALDYWHRTIRLNDRARPLFDQFPGLEAFSIAHEVAHWVLHVDQAVLGQPSLLGVDPYPPILCRHRDTNRREIQAEKFAAYLLMPRDLFFHAIQDTPVTTWSGLYSVARAIGVSISALTIRLTELGVVFAGKDGTLSRFPSGQPSLRHKI